MYTHRFNISSLLLTVITIFLFGCSQPQPKNEPSEQTQSGFKGDIQLDIRDSKADWSPYIRKRAPEGALLDLTQRGTRPRGD